MKLAIISNIYNPYTFGGAEISTELLARGLQERGHDIVILTTVVERHRKGKERIDGITVHRIPTGEPYSVIKAAQQPQIIKVVWHSIDLWNPTAFYRVKNLLREIKPDIVHTNVLAGFSTAVWHAAHNLDIPIVHTLRDYYLLCTRSNLITRGGKLCEERCTLCSLSGVWKKKMSILPDAVVGISQFIFDKHREYGLFTDKPSVVIHNPIDDINEPAPYSLQKHVNGSLKAVFLGRIELAKGPQILLDALSQVKDLNMKVFLCGEGPIENSLKNTYGHDSRIQFVGRVDHEGKRDVLSSADILIAPSVWYEPFNRTVIEAFGYGLPVVASNIGGLRELIEEGTTGMFFPSGDSTALAHTLQKIATNPELLTRMKRNALIRAKDFAIQDQVLQYEAVYENVLLGKNKRIAQEEIA